MITPAIIHEPDCERCANKALFTIPSCYADSTHNFCEAHYIEYKRERDQQANEAAFLREVDQLIEEGVISYVA